jgi:hypothetical protein
MTSTAVISALVTTVLALCGVVAKLALACRSLQEQLDDAREDHLHDLRAIATRGTKLASLLEPPSSDSTD